MATVSLGVVIAQFFCKYDYKLPKASETSQESDVDFLNMDTTLGGINFFAADFLGDYFVVYCSSASTPYSDVTITFTTKEGKKKFHYDYLPPDESMSLSVPTCYSKGNTIKVEYAKCRELSMSKRKKDGRMKVFYNNGDFIGSSYDTIPNATEVFYLEDK